MILKDHKYVWIVIQHGGKMKPSNKITTFCSLCYEPTPAHGRYKKDNKWSACCLKHAPKLTNVTAFKPLNIHLKNKIK